MMEVTNEMMAEHEKLVGFVVRSIKGRIGNMAVGGYETEDLMQIGRLGLYKALKNFDPDRGLKFSTYGVPAIQGEIYKEIRDRLDFVRIPREAGRIYRDLKKRGLTQEDVTIPEIIKYYGCNKERAKIAIELFTVSFISTERPVNSHGADRPYKIEDILPDGNESVEEIVETKLEFERRLSILTEREQTTIKLSISGQYRQRDIAKVIGTNQVQVSRILKRAMAKIDENFNEIAV